MNRHIFVDFKIQIQVQILNTKPVYLNPCNPGYQIIISSGGLIPVFINWSSVNVHKNTETNDYIEHTGTSIDNTYRHAHTTCIITYQ